MKNIVLKTLERTDLMLAIAIIVPLVLGLDVTSLKGYIQILLGIVMYFSIKPFMGHKIHLKHGPLQIVTPILINYVLLSAAYVLPAYLIFGKAHDFFIGYVLIAVVPPAISIIPFCYISRCDEETADIPVLVSSALSLAIIPATLYLLFGKTVNIASLTKIMAIVIVIPMILGYITHRSKNKIFDYSKAVVNTCLGAIIFISISLNRDVFFHLTDPEVITVYVMNIAIVFGLGLAIYYITKRFLPDEATPYTFYATQKNVGTSITLGLLLFRADTAVPAIIALAFQFIYFILFHEFFVKRASKKAGKHA